MATFVALGNLTEQGLKNLEALDIRHKKAVENAEKRGGKILASYALLGPYDFLVILEAPDATTAVHILTKEAEHGNVRYQTLEAFPMDEFAELVQKT
ncbi:MAG: GYD domain-containing protein [Dehalococcoidales bacterium]|nr:GYD domain-containing protein [Dehalococcoidales bacterium]